jgi:hypothetical protein
MSLLEMTMPEKEPAPEPSDVRSEPVNYDDAEVKPPDVIDEVLESAKQTIAKTKEAMPTEEESVVEEPAGGDNDLRIKPVIDDTDIFKDAKPKRKRKPPSEKQLAHLAKAREKATAVRKAKTEANKTAKKKVAFDDVLQKTDPRPRREGATQESLLLHLTRQELLEIQQQAIEGYDTKRKARKKVKQDAQHEVQKANLVNRQIAKAVGQTDPDAFWAECFQ